MQKTAGSVYRKFVSDKYSQFYNCDYDYLNHERSVINTPQLLRRLISFREFIAKHPDTKTVLDVGCSNGYLSRVNEKTELYGIDISKRLIDNAIGYKEVSQASITNIPYPDNHFDLVVCFQVLEHVEDYNKAIKELFRVSKKYVLLSTDFVTKSDRIFSRDLFSNVHGHIHQFGLDKFSKSLKLDKLVIEKTEYHYPLLEYSTIVKKNNVVWKILRFGVLLVNKVINFVCSKLYFRAVKKCYNNELDILLLYRIEKLFNYYGKVVDLEVEACLTIRK